MAQVLAAAEAAVMAKSTEELLAAAKARATAMQATIQQFVEARPNRKRLQALVLAAVQAQLPAVPALSGLTADSLESLVASHAISFIPLGGATDEALVESVLDDLLPILRAVCTPPTH